MPNFICFLGLNRITYMYNRVLWLNELHVRSLFMSKKLDTSLYIKQINNLDEFQPGDTVSVNLRIIEGDKERVQTFDGNVISGRFITSKTPALGDTFTVRRISYGVGVERVLPFHSPNIESLKVTRKGKVRKSKLYYLRGLTGKKARIKEKRS